MCLGVRMDDYIAKPIEPRHSAEDLYSVALVCKRVQEPRGRVRQQNVGSPTFAQEKQIAV